MNLFVSNPLSQPIKLIPPVDLPKEVLRLGADGRVWWNGVEIVTEQEFKEAMIELHHHLIRWNK